MDHHLDREIRLINESEYKSLYSWSLQEFDNDGKEIGTKQIPWYWNLSFTASELSYHQTIETEDTFDFDEDDFRNGDEKAHKRKDSKVNYSEMIIGALHSGWCNDGEYLEDDTSYSMFGTGRNLIKFTLRIIKMEEDAAERCILTGGVSFDYEVDFRDETQDDYMEVYLQLTTERFDLILEAIKNKAPDVVRLRLGRVSGFYSEWSPGISTSHVKILVRGDDQKLIMPDGCDIKPPRLGDVGEFSFSITQRHKLNPKIDLQSLDVDKLFEQGREKDGWGEDVEEIAEKEPDSNSLLSAQLARNEQAISKLKTPLWLIFILLVIALFV